MSDIDDKFQEFHQKNPQVLDHLIKTALRFKAKGSTRLSAKLLWEFARADHWLSSEDRTPWKLCNNHVSRYARLLDAVPELHGMFQMKTLREKSKTDLEEFADWLAA